jgi:hypothetical protein
MRRSPGSLFGGILGVFVLMAVAVFPAHAGPVFNVDLTFADGRTATGSFKIADFCCSHYPTELFLESADITTTGPEGYHYVQGNGDPSPQFYEDNLYLTFNRAGYFGFLVFNFNAPFNVNGSNSLNLAGSFECVDGYQSGDVTDNTCGHGTIEPFQVGVNQTVAPPGTGTVPEPASLVLLVAASPLVALALRRRPV